jgi:hypothetical protein
MTSNDEPQSAASASSMRRWRRLTESPNATTVVVLPG